MSREMPYQPMKGPQKEVSQADMLAILEKHAKRTSHASLAKVEAVVENTSPARVLPSLEWEKPAKGATGVKTTCGRYSCSKVTVSGKTTYEVWRLVPDHWFRQIAIGLESFEKAQEAANAHLRKVST